MRDGDIRYLQLSNSVFVEFTCILRLTYSIFINIPRMRVLRVVREKEEQ